jgi:hypothetical protein
LLARWPARCVRQTPLVNKFAPTERVIPSRVSASVGDNLLARWLRGVSGQPRSRTSSLLQTDISIPSVGTCRRQLVGEMAAQCVSQTPLANKFAPTERIFPSRVSASVGDNLLARWPTRCVRQTPLANKFAPTERIFPSQVSASVGDNLLARGADAVGRVNRAREQVRSYRTGNSKPSVGICRRQLVGERGPRGLSGKHRSRTSSLLQKQLPARCLKPTDVADNLQR